MYNPESINGIKVEKFEDSPEAVRREIEDEIVRYRETMAANMTDEFVIKRPPDDFDEDTMLEICDRIEKQERRELGERRKRLGFESQAICKTHRKSKQRIAFNRARRGCGAR